MLNYNLVVLKKVKAHFFIAVGVKRPAKAIVRLLMR